MIFLSVILLIGFFTFIFYSQRFITSTSKRALMGLFFGVILGFILKYLLSHDQALQVGSIYNQFSNIYMRLLKMVVMPLVFISIVSALIKISKKSDMAKFLGLIIGSLLFMTMLSALIGISVADLLGLKASFFQGLDKQTAPKVNTDIVQLIIGIIPTNPFAAFVGIGDNPVLSVVFISFIVGFAGLSLKDSSPKFYEIFYNNMISLEKIIFMIVKSVVRLTPYFLIPIMAEKVLGDYSQVFGEFLQFFITVYIAVFLAFIMHLIIITLFGYNPFIFIKKGASGLLFAFSTTSSGAALPLSKDILESKMGVNKDLSGLGPTLALTIGQNGCAGIYPAVLAFMSAPLVGIDPISTVFILKLLVVIAISSIGVAGVGGGGTLAALIVLPLMGLPIELVGIFLAIEPLIDMGRTFLNVSGGWVSTLITAKLTHNIDKKIYLENN